MVNIPIIPMVIYIHMVMYYIYIYTWLYTYNMVNIPIILSLYIQMVNNPINCGYLWL